MFFSWVILITLSLNRFLLHTQELLNNKPFKLHLGLFVISIVPIILIYLATPPSYCVGTSILGEVVVPRGNQVVTAQMNDLKMILGPSTKILAPKNRVLAPPLVHNPNLFPAMREGQEYSVFPIFNKKTGAKIYQFLPRDGFKQPPGGGNYFLRHYEIYHLYANNTY
jgi:hypothetical protein